MTAFSIFESTINQSKSIVLEAMLKNNALRNLSNPNLYEIYPDTFERGSSRAFYFKAESFSTRAVLLWKIENVLGRRGKAAAFVTRN